jgi:hypothetical protein
VDQKQQREFLMARVWHGRSVLFLCHRILNLGPEVSRTLTGEKVPRVR